VISVTLAGIAQVSVPDSTPKGEEKLTPELGKGGINHCPHQAGCSCLEIKLPDGVLGGAGWEELHI